MALCRAGAKALLLVAVSLLAATLVAPAGVAQEVTYAGSVQVATGDYIFADRTTSGYFFNGLSFTYGRLRANFSVPIILQNSPWVSYGGGGSVPSGGPQHGSVGGREGNGGGRRRAVALPDTSSYGTLGFGDPLARAEIGVLSDCDRWPNVGVALSVKPPLADAEHGFGTGAWDAGIGLSLSRHLDPWHTSAEGMIWRLGDMDDLELKDAFSFAASIGRSLGSGPWGALASISGYTEIIDEVDPPLQVGVGVSYVFLPAASSLSAHVALGLTEASPDFSLAVGWLATL